METKNFGNLADKMRFPSQWQNLMNILSRRQYYSSAYTISRIVQLLNNPLGRAVIAFDDKSLLKETM